MSEFLNRFVVPGMAILLLAASTQAQSFDGLNPEYANPFLFKRSQLPVSEPGNSKISAVAQEREGLFEAVDEAEYIVGPGDYFQVVTGSKSEFVSVNPEGFVILESAPPIHVALMTLVQAKREIQKTLATQYKGDWIHVSLAQAKVFQVSMTGEVSSPGLYSFESGIRLSSALVHAGGFSYLASRRISIIGSNGETRDYDLSSYFSEGNLSQNPYLKQGDRIIAPRVNFSGNVVYVRADKGLRAVEAAQGESLEEILRRHENFSAVWEWISVRVYEGDQLKEIVLRKDAAGYVPASGSVLEPVTLKKAVFVGGTVVQPGIFDYDPTLSIGDYISKAGVTVNTVRDLGEATVIDASGNVRKVDARHGLIFPGDHIWVPRSTEAKTRDYVGLISSVSSLAVAIATLVLLISTR